MSRFAVWCDNPVAGHDEYMRAGMQIQEQKRVDATYRAHNRGFFNNSDKPGVRFIPKPTDETRRYKRFGVRN